MKTPEQQIEELRDYIHKNYKPEDGAKTSLFSEGNGDDQFSDGETRGTALTLNTIAEMFDIAVPAPHEQDFDD